MESSGRSGASGEQRATGAQPEVLIRSRLVPYLRLLVLAVIIFAAGIYILLMSDDLVPGVVCLAAAAIQALPWAWLFVRARRHLWAVRIGPDGVTWSDGPVHVPWSDVAELRVDRRRLVPVFVRLPGVRLVSRAEADFAARASSRPAGYYIDTRQLQATPDDVLAAISRFVQVPVVHE